MCCWTTQAWTCSQPWAMGARVWAQVTRTRPRLASQTRPGQVTAPWRRARVPALPTLGVGPVAVFKLVELTVPMVVAVEVVVIVEEEEEEEEELQLPLVVAPVRPLRLQQLLPAQLGLQFGAPPVPPQAVPAVLPVGPPGQALALLCLPPGPVAWMWSSEPGRWATPPSQTPYRRRWVRVLAWVAGMLLGFLLQYLDKS